MLYYNYSKEPLKPYSKGPYMSAASRFGGLGNKLSRAFAAKSLLF